MLGEEIAKSKEPLVIVVMGASGAGKSTVAEELASRRDDLVVVSSDGLRMLLTGNASNMAISRKAFKQAIYGIWRC